MHVCMYVCMCVCMYVCMHVCMYVCLYIYIYTISPLPEVRHIRLACDRGTVGPRSCRGTCLSGALPWYSLSCGMRWTPVKSTHIQLENPQIGAPLFNQVNPEKQLW